MATREEIAAQVKRAQASAANLRAEAAELRELGEDLEDEEMLRAAGRLDAQARRTEQTIAKAAALHTKDSDCTVDPKTGCCTTCGVDHSGSCACGGRGFHVDGCGETTAVSP